MNGHMVEQQPIARLVERAQAGDREAFDNLVEHYQERVRGVIQHRMQTQRHVDVDEILQETFVRAFESLSRFQWQGEKSFYLWLCGIARNVVLKATERAQSARRLESPEDVASPAKSPSRIMRRDERFDRLEEALTDLSPEYREVIKLSRLDGLKISEIAARLGRTEYAIRHLIARAILQLRKTLGETESLHLPDRTFRMDEESDGSR